MSRIEAAQHFAAFLAHHHGAQIEFSYDLADDFFTAHDRSRPGCEYVHPTVIGALRGLARSIPEHDRPPVSPEKP